MLLRSTEAEDGAEDFQACEEHAGEQAEDETSETKDTATEVEIKDAEEEAEDAEDADEPSHFEEAIDAASESEE